MFVVYGLFSEGEVFYIGKTTDDRLAQRLHEHRYHAMKANKLNRKVYNKIRKLIREHKDITIKPLFVTDNEDEQNAKEVELIAQYGRDLRRGGKLYNSTEGGDGVVGHQYTPEQIKKMSDAKLGNKINLGRKRPDMVKRFSKPVTVFDLDGTLIQSFSSLTEAGKSLGFEMKIASGNIKRGSTTYAEVLGRRVNICFN